MCLLFAAATSAGNMSRWIIQCQILMSPHKWITSLRPSPAFWKAYSSRLPAYPVTRHRMCWYFHDWATNLPCRINAHSRWVGYECDSLLDTIVQGRGISNLWLPWWDAVSRDNGNPFLNAGPAEYDVASRYLDDTEFKYPSFDFLQRWASYATNLSRTVMA